MYVERQAGGTPPHLAMSRHNGNRKKTQKCRVLCALHPDDALKNAGRTKILHYRRLYAGRSDPIVFMPIAASTSGRVYHDCIRLLFLHAHREAAAPTGEIPRARLVNPMEFQETKLMGFTLSHERQRGEIKKKHP